MKKFGSAGPLFIVMLLWGLNLGYPMQHLQHIRWTFAGYVLPVYYLFNVLPIVGAAAFALAFKRHWTKWELLWWLLPLICLPGILQSGDPVWSTRQWSSWMVRGLLPGGIIFLVADRNKARRMLLYWIYPIIIAASLLGIAEIYYDYNPLWDNSLLPIPETSQPQNPFYRPVYSHYSLAISARPQGTQGNRIPYASTLVAFLPLGVWLLKYAKRFYWAHLLAINILFSILLLSQARSVWIGAVTAIALVYAVSLQRNLRETIKINVGIIVCLGLFLAWHKTYTLFWWRYKTFHLAAGSIQSRLEVLKTAAVLKDRWFSGVGFGQFPVACRPYYHSAIPWVGTPDNQYIRWAIENGLPSFMLLAAFCAGLVFVGWKRIRQMEDVEQADFYRALLVGWLSIAVTFLFFDGFYWGACNMTFWSLLGLFATCLKPPDPVDVGAASLSAAGRES